jgi:AbrB family looped-hinge helix DNA binding protein
MKRVVLSSKYQIVIPLDIRKRLHLSAGQGILLVPHGNTVHLVADRDISEMQGAFPSISTDGFREETERL